MTTHIHNFPCTLYMLTIKTTSGVHTAVIFADNRTEVFNAAVTTYSEHLLSVEITKEVNGFSGQIYSIPLLPVDC